MAAATLPIPSKTTDGVYIAVPVQAAAKILAGWLVAVGKLGAGAGVQGHAKALAAADAATHEFLGVAVEDADNTSGVAAALDVKVRVDGCAQELLATGLTDADHGKDVYAVDNQTVQVAAAPGAAFRVGVIAEVLSATRAKVVLREFKNVGIGAGGALQLLASGASMTNSNAETVLASHTIKAGRLRKGDRVKIDFMARVTADAGATTLTGRLRVGAATLVGTAIITTAAVDTASGDFMRGTLDLTVRDNPAAAAIITGHGEYGDPGAAGAAAKAKEAVLVPTAFATNADLLVELTGQWSAADANAVQAEVLNVEIIPAQ